MKITIKTLLRINYCLFFTLIIVKILDILTTIIGLQMGYVETNLLLNMYENNPFIYFIISFFIIFILLILTIIFRKRKVTLQYIMALNMIFLLALIFTVFNNLYYIYL